jgi:carbon-monoxide dehydrogenase medium subunit
VKPAPFDYHRPETLEETLELLADGEGKVLAGGQSLVPLMSMRLASPARIVDVNRVRDLDRIEVGDRAARVGALVRHRQVELSPDLRRVPNTLPCKAAEHIAHATIRNRGTTVGSIVHADPAAEMPAVLGILGGGVEVVSRDRGRRTIAAQDLFLGPLESALESDEIAVAATFPHPSSDAGTAWVELSRRQGDYALVGVGAVVTLDRDGRMTDARLGLISVGPTPVMVDLTPVVSGRLASDVVDAAEGLDLPEIAEAVDAAVDPEADIHASADYRRHLARRLSMRAVLGAVRDAVDWSPVRPGEDEDGVGRVEDDG